MITWRGASFYHRGDIVVPMTRETIDITDIEPFAATFRSQDKQMLEANFTPSGRLSEISNLVNRYSTSTRGDLINVEEFTATCDASTDVVTIPSGNLLATGDEVMMHALITQPGGVSRTTRYYWRSASGTTGTLHTSASGASANTGKVDITTAGSGAVLSVGRPLIIHTRKGLKLTYYCAALTKIPSLRFKAGETLLGETGFRFFVRPGQDPADLSAAYFLAEYAAFTDTSFDPADLPREFPVVTWANGSPWSDGLASRDGANVEFELSTEDLPSDAFGNDALGRIFTNLNLTVTASPQGVTEAEAMAALKVNSGKRGDDLAGDGALDLDTPTYNFEVADAALVEAPQNFGSSTQRAGDFVWRGMPTFTAGARDPLYTLTEN